MGVTLKPVFSALGYESPAQQRGLVKLLQAAGAFGKLPGITGVVTDKQADAILDSVTFDNTTQAANWLHDLTQETMKRPEGQARSETPDRADFNANRDSLLKALEEAGMLSDKDPKFKHYDHVLVLGSKELTAELRIDDVEELWNQGIRFDNIHLLGNERTLDKSSEPIAAMPSENGQTLSNETEMLKAHFYERREAWPAELKAVPTFAVKSFDKDGRNANTKDTIETWLSATPQPDHGNVLVISSQPYVAYQDAAVKSVLPAGYNVDTVGVAIQDKDVNIALAMDALARQIDVNFTQLVEKSASQSTDLKTSLMMLDPAKIKADPATYQFRSNYDNASGVTKAHRIAADKWDPILHGDPLIVHERLDGSMFVADGHHRLELAQRLNQSGTGPGQVAAIVLREADGYTAEDVKIIAAYKNISSGKDDPIETAKVFKEAYSGKVHTQWLPKLQMDKGNLEVSYKLSKLSDAALDKVVKEEIPIEMAADVATQVQDAKGQEAVISTVAEELHKGGDKQMSFADKFSPKAPSGSFADREKPRDHTKNFAEKHAATKANPSLSEGAVR